MTGSAPAPQPVPYYGVYAATRACVISWRLRFTGLLLRRFPTMLTGTRRRDS